MKEERREVRKKEVNGDGRKWNGKLFDRKR